ncbi:MAG: ParB/RepB/Spo0J family partition protein [Cytophagales bacterium]|nr:ParB/RepB/Spo0J family partition protein [Cytophagales bacterium]
MAKGKQKTGLGKGLGALLSDSDAVEEKQVAPAAVEKKETSDIGEILVASIEVNPFQPRTDFDEDALEELAESIKTQGIIQPITVRKLSDDAYQLISGERRLQASKRAGLEKVPAYIRTADDQQMLEMALIENIQRENLNSIEIALSYQRLLSEIGLKQEELGDRVGKKRTTVNNYLRLLKLPPAVQAALRDKEISMGHAKALLSIENIDLQLNVFNKIINEALSVRKAEELARTILNGTTAKPKPPTSENGEILRLQDQLSSHFGTKIKIKSDQGNRGEIKIPFVSTEDLNRILEILEV